MLEAQQASRQRWSEMLQRYGGRTMALRQETVSLLEREQWERDQAKLRKQREERADAKINPGMPALCLFDHTG